MKILWLDMNGGTTREENLSEEAALDHLAQLAPLLGSDGGAVVVSSGPCYDYNQNTGVVQIFTPGEYCRNLHEECLKNGCAKLQTD